MPRSRSVHVAVGVIVNAEDEVCIALRPQDKHMGGLWEFPGGKVEDGESVTSALKRELHEELGIEPLSSEPLVFVEHNYTDKRVCLDVHWVKEFNGEAHGREAQEVRWVARKHLTDYQFPEANIAILKAVLKAPR